MVGRKPKPNLSWDEVQALRLHYAKRRGHATAAAMISLMRGADAVSLTRQQRNKRLVSEWWVAKQPEVRGIIAELKSEEMTPRGNETDAPTEAPRGNEMVTDDAGSRITRSETSDDSRTPQKPEETQPLTKQVESEQPGATQ